MPRSMRSSPRCTRSPEVAPGIFASLTRAFRRDEPPADDFVASQYSKLSAAQRVDFIFAIAAVEDSSTVDLLQRALDDSDEAVALAAARALAGGGRNDELERFFATHRGERATRLARTLELLS
jgi:HEAT repeat protein